MSFLNVINGFVLLMINKKKIQISVMKRVEIIDIKQNKKSNIAKNQQIIFMIKIINNIIIVVANTRNNLNLFKYVF